MVTLVIPGGWSPSVDIRVDNILSLTGKDLVVKWPKLAKTKGRFGSGVVR